MSKLVKVLLTVTGVALGVTALIVLTNKKKKSTVKDEPLDKPSKPVKPIDPVFEEEEEEVIDTPNEIIEETLDKGQSLIDHIIRPNDLDQELKPAPAPLEEEMDEDEEEMIEEEPVERNLTIQELIDKHEQEEEEKKQAYEDAVDTVNKTIEDASIKNNSIFKQFGF